MLRTIVTLVLAIAAVAVATTPRGSAVLGPMRNLLVAALLVLAVLQGYRLVSLWQARRRDDLRKKIPKRPLGI